jgi:hypothetical protein
MPGREHEDAAGLPQDRGQTLQRRFDIDTQRREHIGTAGLRGQSPVAMLGNLHAAGREHKGIGGGNIQRGGAIAAGAADVDRVFRNVDRDHPAAQGADRAGQLGHRFAARPQSHQQAADLHLRRLAVHDEAKGGFRLFLAQSLAGGEAP